MDAMTDELDPALAIGVPRLHLEEARGLAVDLHKHLDAARKATPHVISQGVDGRQLRGLESMPWDQPLTRPSLRRPRDFFASRDRPGGQTFLW
ncbi:hypothetical protein G5V59_19245 [Nocardioides sp. W3-2-3]|uniref:hypothetical protein n=1 Tax=Nocardioides convexus TaxID=2712224 RepID=UPI0024182FA6|nr:hypothetical protein [Nocardioides convexus]NHA01265.1 hypothetical protein [Nocardioides convexus]